MMHSSSVPDPMEFEPALKGEETEEEQQPTMINPVVFLHNLYVLVCMYASYYRNVTIGVGAFLVILTVVGMLDMFATMTTKKHQAMISNDYTDAHSIYELKMAKVDHWCLDGGDDDCTCNDPTMPLSRETTHHWMKTFHSNRAKADAAATAATDVDVVFLGDSSIEEWNGKWMGMAHEENIKGISSWYSKTFKREKGGDVEGLALGIAGDTVSNLYWRIKHGEMPYSLNPKVWWISVGANDLENGQCAEEIVLLGILRLAEEISLQKPGSIIVINSILPRLDKIKPQHVKHGKTFDLWPSIQVINEQLEKFCTKHQVFQFFDATALFFQSKPPTSKEFKKSKHLKMPALKPGVMVKDKFLTLAGHKLWGKAIVDQVKRIMFDESLQAQNNQIEVNAYDDDYIFDDAYMDDFALRD